MNEMNDIEDWSNRNGPKYHNVKRQGQECIAT